MDKSELFQINAFIASIAAYANVSAQSEKRKNLSPKAGFRARISEAVANIARSILNGCRKNHLYEFSDENKSRKFFDDA